MYNFNIETYGEVYTSVGSFKFCYPDLVTGVASIDRNYYDQRRVADLARYGDKLSSLWTHYHPTLLPRVIWRDCYGVIIPNAAVAEAQLRVEKEQRKRWSRRARKFSFRRGPVPHTRKWRGGSWYRSVKTFAEIRETEFLDLDEDVLDLPTAMRPKARRDLPTAWDDIGTSRTRSWKAHRAAQWKD